MAFLIEDDDLMQECIDYLKQHGARQFSSDEEFQRWLNSLK